MLALPADWRTIAAGAITRDLLKQVRFGMQRDQCASHLIAASLEVTVTNARQRQVHIQSLSEFQWKVGNLVYQYLPCVDEHTLATFKEMYAPFDRLVIVPIGKDVNAESELEAILHSRAPTVFPVDTFISWRAMWVALDASRTRPDVILDVLNVYNDRIRRSELDREFFQIDVSQASI